jgi:hypothetical protein
MAGCSGIWDSRGKPGFFVFQGPRGLGTWQTGEDGRTTCWRLPPRFLIARREV